MIRKLVDVDVRSAPPGTPVRRVVDTAPTARRIPPETVEKGLGAVRVKKPKKRKFYKAVFQIEVLSEEPIPDMSSEDIAYQTRDGHMSGHFLETTRTTMTGKQLAEALGNQGSSPEFFRLDEDGNDIDE